MITVNPVNFTKVEKKYRYAVNPQFLRSFKGPRAPLSERLNCTLKALSVYTSRVPGNSYIRFVCVKGEHINRFCTRNASAIKISRQVFQTNNTSFGNVIVRMYPGRCHSCGEHSLKCWAEYTGHLVCSGCVARGVSSAPYPYGKLEKKCCVANGCGSALKWFSETDEELLCRAIGSYERHTSV